MRQKLFFQPECRLRRCPGGSRRRCRHFRTTLLLCRSLRRPWQRWRRQRRRWWCWCRRGRRSPSFQGKGERRGRHEGRTSFRLNSFFFRDFDRALWRFEVVVSNARRFSGFLYPSIHSIISLVHSFLRAVHISKDQT